MFKKAENVVNLKEPRDTPPPVPAPVPAFRIPDGALFAPAARFAGAFTGYEYKTCDGTTGYYKTLPRVPPLAWSLDRLITSPTLSQDAPIPYARRAWRRPRGDGARFRGKGRTAKPLRKLEDFLPIKGGATEIIDEEYREYGLWAIDTVNPNSWTAAEERLMCRTGSDFVLLQESRVSSENGIAKMKRDARNFGWKTVAEPAWASPAGPGSGVALSSRGAARALLHHPGSKFLEGYVIVL